MDATSGPRTKQETQQPEKHSLTTGTGNMPLLQYPESASSSPMLSQTPPLVKVQEMIQLLHLTKLAQLKKNRTPKSIGTVALYHQTQTVLTLTLTVTPASAITLIHRIMPSLAQQSEPSSLLSSWPSSSQWPSERSSILRWPISGRSPTNTGMLGWHRTNRTHHQQQQEFKWSLDNRWFNNNKLLCNQVNLKLFTSNNERWIKSLKCT